MLGGALVAAAVVAATGSSRLGKSTARVVGGNLPVDPGGSDKGSVAAYNSPAVRANPRNGNDLVVAERVDTPQTTCAVQTSTDGGATWTPVPVAFPADKLVPCFAPDVAFGADGTAYLEFSTFATVPGEGSVPDALWIATSTDGGRSFAAPRRVEGPVVLQARLVADPTVPRRLYLTWLKASHTGGWGLADTGSPIVVARSDDAGATWGAPVPASAPGRARVVAPSLAVGADGYLLLAYLDVGDDRLDYNGAHEGLGGDPYPKAWSLVAARSGDGGVTWSETTVDRQVLPTQRFLMLFPPTPSLAVDRRHGRAYVAFHDGRLGDADVWLWASTDGGRRWRRPVRVNDTKFRDGTSQYLPAVGVAPDGRVDVVYYDRRADRRDVTTAVSLQSSFNGGKSFSARLGLSDTGFDSGIGSGASRNMPELGNRLGIVSVNNGALALWTDTRAGTRQNGKQDIARVVAAIHGPSRWPAIVQAASLVVGLLGLVLVAAAFLGRRRRRAPPPCASADDTEIAQADTDAEAEADDATPLGPE